MLLIRENIFKPPVHYVLTERYEPNL